MSAVDLVLATTAPPGLFSRFLRSLRAELRKVRTTRGTQWMLGVIGALWVIAGAGVAAVSLLGGAGGVSVTGALLGMGAAVVVFIPILGILIMAGDWQSRDVVTSFVLEPRRHIVFWAKVTAALILGLLLVVSAAAVAVAFAALIAAIAGRALDWDFDASNASTLLWGAGVGVVSGVAYGAALQRVTLAIVISLVQGFVIDPMLMLVPHGVGGWFRLGAVADFGGAAGGQWGPALLATLLWLAAPLTIGFLRNQRADVQ